MLTALMDGRALTASELGGAAGVTLQTASGHLARLVEAGCSPSRKQGRHRYFRLSGPDVAEALEALMGLAQRTGAVRVRTGPRDAALREARICYDHLAGERGVALLDALRGKRLVEGEQDVAPHRGGPHLLRRARRGSRRAGAGPSPALPPLPRLERTARPSRRRARRGPARLDGRATLAAPGGGQGAALQPRRGARIRNGLSCLKAPPASNSPTVTILRPRAVSPLITSGRASRATRFPNT